ncbi:hypothetical protein J3R82DRAFT_9321 [Butyriboletus roseoflavus]|nr:hypothetical protein J3R82DRAFT_9321 [Butyriboletus roseoflavus]
MFAKLSTLLLCVAFGCALLLNPPNIARDIAANLVYARGPDTDVPCVPPL